jgi:phage terminase large subunit-like protein
LLHQRLYDAARELLDLDETEQREFFTRALPRDRWTFFHALETDWPSRARAKQLFPWEKVFRYLAVVCGRGFGKTLMGAETVREAAESGVHEWISVCAPTVATLYRDQLTGPTGLLTISPRWFMPVHHSTRNELWYPRHPITGIRTRVGLLSADKPDRIRSSQCSFLWADEPQAWKKPTEAFQMLDMSLRLGKPGRTARGIITLTPKDHPFSRDLLFGPVDEATGRRVPRPDVLLVRGSTYENTDLDPDTLKSYESGYKGTSLAKQELEGELILKPEGALWNGDVIEQHRVPGISAVKLVRKLVAVDPSRSLIGIGDLCGIIVLALGSDGHVYVLADLTIRGGPLQWAQKAVDAAQLYGADAIVYERNRISGDIARVVRMASEQSGTHWKPITAQGSKQVRAEPVSALYTAGRVHHVGRFEHLEDEMTSWDPRASRDSPDRLDALVHGVTELALGRQQPALVVR